MFLSGNPIHLHHEPLRTVVHSIRCDPKSCKNIRFIFTLTEEHNYNARANHSLLQIQSLSEEILNQLFLPLLETDIISTDGIREWRQCVPSDNLLATVILKDFTDRTMPSIFRYSVKDRSEVHFIVKMSRGIPLIREVGDEDDIEVAQTPNSNSSIMSETVSLTFNEGEDFVHSYRKELLHDTFEVSSNAPSSPLIVPSLTKITLAKKDDPNRQNVIERTSSPMEMFADSEEESQGD